MNEEEINYANRIKLQDDIVELININEDVHIKNQYLICCKLIFRNNAFKVIRIGFILIESYIGQNKYVAETINPDQLYSIIAKITEYRDCFELEDIIAYLDRIINIVKILDLDSKAAESMQIIIKNFIEELLSNSLKYNL